MQIYFGIDYNVGGGKCGHIFVSNCVTKEELRHVYSGIRGVSNIY